MLALSNFSAYTNYNGRSAFDFMRELINYFTNLQATHLNLAQPALSRLFVSSLFQAVPATKEIP
jgi:hypothetical protein